MLKLLYIFELEVILSNDAYKPLFEVSYTFNYLNFTYNFELLNYYY